MYYEMTAADIEEDIVYVTFKELQKRTGVAKSTLNYQIHTNVVDAFMFRNRTYFKPDAAAAYETLFKRGLLK